jgi:hypothetical protein
MSRRSDPIHARVRKPALRPASYTRHSVQKTKATTTATDGIVRRIESWNLRLPFICVSDLFPRGKWPPHAPSRSSSNVPRDTPDIAHATCSRGARIHGLAGSALSPIDASVGPNRRVELRRDCEPLANPWTGRPTWRRMQDLHLNAQFAARQASGSGEPSARTSGRDRPLLIFSTVLNGG